MGYKKEFKKYYPSKKIDYNCICTNSTPQLDSLHLDHKDNKSYVITLTFLLHTISLHFEWDNTHHSSYPCKLCVVFLGNVDTPYNLRDTIIKYSFHTNYLAVFTGHELCLMKHELSIGTLHNTFNEFLYHFCLIVLWFISLRERERERKIIYGFQYILPFSMNIFTTLGTKEERT